MCEILRFPKCFVYLTPESAQAELQLARICHEEARHRRIEYWSTNNRDYFRFTLDRLHEAQLWAKVAREERQHGA